MIPLDVFGSEAVAANLLQQVRWCDGVTCPRCRSDRTVRNGSYREFQRYLCKNCDRTFNDKTGTIFAHSKVALRLWLFSIYAFLRFNTSLSQLQYEIGVTHKTVHRRIECFTRALDAPSLDLVGPVEIDEVYVSAGKKVASAIKSRARVGCPRVGAEHMMVTSHPCSLLLTAVPDSGT